MTAPADGGPGAPRRRRWLATGLLLLAGCRGAPAAPRLFGSGGEEAVDAPVAAVGERRFTKAHLGDYWFHRYPEEYARTLDEMVEEWLVWSEARQGGVTVPEARLAAAVEREVEARRAQVRDLLGPDADLEAEVRRAYGLGLAAWRERVLRPRLATVLLKERVVRLDSRRRARLHARVIVLADPARARWVRAQLERGADFALLARQESRDPSGRRGGDLPWIARGDLVHPGVEEALFAAPAGALVGPLAVEVDGVPQWHLYRVLEHAPAWAEGGGDLAARLEADLVAAPVGPGEVLRWRLRRRAERGIRYFRPDGTPWTPGTPPLGAGPEDPGR